jgi:hypothetical protein
MTFQELIDAGIEQAAIDHVAGLFKVRLAPTATADADQHFRDELNRLHKLIDHVKNEANT